MLQAALILIPTINEIKREIDIFDREFVIMKNIPLDFFGIIYLKCVKGEKEKLNTYKMNGISKIHVRSHHLSPFQQCPILSMRTFILVKLFTVSDIRRFLQDDEIEDYDDDYDDVNYDDDYNHNNNTDSQDTNNYPTNIKAEASNSQTTVHQTYLLESSFISRNPLTGNDFAAIKTSLVKRAPRVEVDINITHPHPRNLPFAETVMDSSRLSNG